MDEDRETRDALDGIVHQAQAGVLSSEAAMKQIQDLLETLCRKEDQALHGALQSAFCDAENLLLAIPEIAETEMTAEGRGTSPRAKPALRGSFREQFQFDSYASVSSGIESRLVGKPTSPRLYKRPSPSYAATTSPRSEQLSSPDKQGSMTSPHLDQEISASDAGNSMRLDEGTSDVGKDWGQEITVSDVGKRASPAQPATTLPRPTSQQLDKPDADKSTTLTACWDKQASPRDAGKPTTSRTSPQTSPRPHNSPLPKRTSPQSSPRQAVETQTSPRQTARWDKQASPRDAGKPTTSPPRTSPQTSPRPHNSPLPKRTSPLTSPRQAVETQTSPRQTEVQFVPPMLGRARSSPRIPRRELTTEMRTQLDKGVLELLHVAAARDGGDVIFVFCNRL